MEPKEYYRLVLRKIKNCFHYNDYVIATGKELKKEGADDPGFPALVTSIDDLNQLTVEKCLQVHLPVVGKNSHSVIMPMDFELFLSEDNSKLYTDKESQKYYFRQTVPVIDFIKKIFIDRGMPFLLDYTPSGGHILFHNIIGKRSTAELSKIGYIEDDLITAINKKVPGNFRRRNGTSWEATSVFSGLTKIAEYVSLLTMKAFRNNEAEGKLPVTVSDSLKYCINLDNSWCEGSPFMRSIRSPFSLHKKNHENYDRYDEPPLVDVVGCLYDGKRTHGEIAVDQVIDCMWDLEKAAEHAQNFTGNIPCSNDTLIDFIEEYKASDLYKLHREFDSQANIPAGKAIEYAKQENRIPDWSRNILYNPNPLAVQPINMIGFIYDFVIYAKWHPKHVANILRDMYLDGGNKWTQDFQDSYPAEEKANFWARIFSSIAYMKKGWINI